MPETPAPPLPDDVIRTMQREVLEDPIDRVRWLLITQSSVFHLLHSATLVAVSESIAIDNEEADAPETNSISGE